MDRLRAGDGYALLAALVITSLAGLFAAACVAAVGARHDVAAADLASARAQAALARGFDDVCSRLRRSPSVPEGDYRAAAGQPEAEAWQATWTSLPGTVADGFPQIGIEVEASAGGASARLSAVIELRGEACAQGVVVGEDADLCAPVEVKGSGLYCGGCVRGREWLRFGGDVQAPADTSPAVDGVRGDRWPAAGVHAAGSIWAAGEEVHQSSEIEECAADTDTHTGETSVVAPSASPSAALVRFVEEQAVAPGEALRGALLDLALLPAHAGGASMVGTGGDGYAVLVRPETDDVGIVGERPAGACPITLVVDGDAWVGRADMKTSMQGALIVLGQLDVSGSFRLEGHLYARRLRVDAPLLFATPVDWRQRLLPGLAVPAIVSLAGP